MALDSPTPARRVAIYGGTSTLAHATARCFAAEGAHLHLVARDATRLAPQGVAVVTIKPGPIDTPMTAHLPRSPLFAAAGPAGQAIHRALLRRRAVAYVPGWWWPIMTLLRLLPEALFRRVPG